jgi:hypothetical protein
MEPLKSAIPQPDIAWQFTETTQLRRVNAPPTAKAVVACA